MVWNRNHFCSSNRERVYLKVHEIAIIEQFNPSHRDDSQKFSHHVIVQSNLNIFNFNIHLVSCIKKVEKVSIQLITWTWFLKTAAKVVHVENTPAIAYTSVSVKWLNTVLHFEK